MIGKTVAHYRVSEKLGEGGMGVVYRAHDSKLGREVAIKVLPEALSGDAERLARFEREARILASLNHPGIATLYGLEYDGGKHFLVMELVPGRRWQRGSREARSPSTKRFRSLSRSPTRSKPRTKNASATEI